MRCLFLSKSCKSSNRFKVVLSKLAFIPSDGYIQDIVIIGHGSSTGVFGSWDAAFYSDNISNGEEEPFLEGKADVGDLANATIGGWFDDPTIKFAEDATICFLSCRAGKEYQNDEKTYSYTVAEQITLETGVTTIAASGGVSAEKRK